MAIPLGCTLSTTKMSALERLAILGRAFRLATYGLDRQLRVAALVLVMAVAVSVGAWHLTRTAGPKTPFASLDTASAARVVAVGDGFVAVPPQSQWPINCKKPVLVLELRDPVGRDAGTGFFYPTLDPAIGVSFPSADPRTTRTHMACADSWPLRMVDSRPVAVRN